MSQAERDIENIWEVRRLLAESVVAEHAPIGPTEQARAQCWGQFPWDLWGDDWLSCWDGIADVSERIDRALEALGI